MKFIFLIYIKFLYHNNYFYKRKSFIGLFVKIIKKLKVDVRNYIIINYINKF